jgi:hypothetical protein
VNGASAPRRARVFLSAAILAVVLAAGLLAAAITTTVRRPHPSGATLRPLAGDTNMSDADAATITAATIGIWVRERNADHVPNVLAVTCPNPLPGLLPQQLKGLQTNQPPPDSWVIDGTGPLTRTGADWSMAVFLQRGTSFGQVATVRVADGEARLCGLQNAPIPPGAP